MKTTRIYLIVLLLSVINFPHKLYSQGIELPDYLYEEFRKRPSPINGVSIKLNPTELQWPSVKYWEGKDVVYNVYLSRDSLFPATKTQVNKNQRYCFYNPHKRLEPGVWFWKYEIIGKDKVETKGIFSFVVPREIPSFETPSFYEFIGSISKKHPRVINQGNDINLIHKHANTHPAYHTIMEKGMKILKLDIYNGPLDDKDQAVAKRLQKISSLEINYFHEALQAYILSGKKELFDNLVSRINVLLTWPTNDLLGSQVLTALSVGYDALYNELSSGLRSRMIQCINKQLCKGLADWPGKVEARQVDNHFWQMELAGNFSAALATIHDSEFAKDMLEYTYELFIARFPNLSTKSDGGWAEGIGYFRVNQSCIIDMALLMKKHDVDVFKMPWYKQLPNYYIYFAPAGGQISGFGDMHDRVNDGTNVDLSSSLVLACETNEPLANYRLWSQLNQASKRKQLLNNTLPWYQIVNNINLDPDKLAQPRSMPDDMLFYDPGIAAMHADISDPKGTVLYFRSSPFGAKGHMHANQNSFNIAREGERLFYSTGYYTSFADPHSMTSYRNTRAHNTILVDGCGQAFGHEGYGFIKRFLFGKEVSYICGDATAAYKPTVDKQFLAMNAESDVKETKEYGVTDVHLKLFERHLVFIRPDIVVVYDVLESKQNCDWTFLLHTMKDQRPEIDSNGTFHVTTSKNAACVNVFASLPLDITCTDNFFSPAIDFKKKYQEVPNQHHTSYKTKMKTKAVRFLAVLQLGGTDEGFTSISTCKNGKIRLGEISIKAELNTDKPARLTVETAGSKLRVQTQTGTQKSYTILKEDGKKEVISYDRYPE